MHAYAIWQYHGHDLTNRVRQFKPRHDLLYASASVSGLALPEEKARLADPIFYPTLDLYLLYVST
jgi:hypothetical protein